MHAVSRAPSFIARANNACVCSNSKPPLIEALGLYRKLKHTPFHIPGHKLGSGVHPSLLEVVGRDTLLADLTELPGLDNLADPSGPLAESQALAASIHEANRTWFLVNGTTVGIQAAIMATCKPGSTLVVARNCHCSAFSGMVLSDSSPAWIIPEWDHHSQIFQSISPKQLENMMLKTNAASQIPAAVLVVSPSYYGVCSDISGLAAVCHEHGIPLIVDEAHGSHLGLHPSFPASAMQQGADISVQSTHKTLSALGQASMLHCQGSLVSQEKLSQCLRLLQTTSPSYLLLASLDAAQAQAALMKGGQLQLPVTAIQETRQKLRKLPGIHLLEDSLIGQNVQMDPWRLTVDVQNLGMSGFDAEKYLQDEHQVYPEMATHTVVVFAMGPGTCQSHLDELVASLSALSSSCTGNETRLPYHSNFHEWDGGRLWKQQLTPREAFFSPKSRIPFQDAVDCISGDLICPYPPGIPVVYPGEQVSAACLDLLLKVQQAGGQITGTSDKTLKEMCVIHAAM